MSRSTGLWIIPYFIAAIVWVIIYKNIGSVADIYFAGKQNPMLFILILGMFIHMIVGIIRGWHRPRERE